MQLNTVYLLLGSNMGERSLLIEQALQKIDFSAGTIVQTSHIYETAAWGNEHQQLFLNMAVQIQTEKNARQLLSIFQDIEKQLGRVRKENWEPRTIDIDILFFNLEIINDDDLIIPHRQMHLRRFTLEPLAEIAGEFIHPVFNQTVTELLKKCPDTLSVKMLTDAV